MPAHRLLTAPIAAALAALAVGCGETTIDHEKAEDLARKVGNSGTVKLESVSCPEGVKAEKGKDFDCDLVYSDGTKATITLHQTSDDGDVRTAGTDIKIEEK